MAICDATHRCKLAESLAQNSPFRADHGAPFAGLCSVQVRYPVAYEIFKVQQIRAFRRV